MFYKSHDVKISVVMSFNSPQSLPSVALMGSVLIVDQPRERGSGFITLLKLPCFVLGKAPFN